MKATNELRNRKGVSPVIATVILVAITITVAVAVAYWMSGIAGQYTKFEKVEIQSAYSSKWDDGAQTLKGWKISIQLQNTGSAESTIIECFINDAPLSEYGTDVAWQYDDDDDPGTVDIDVPLEGISLVSGGKVSTVLYIYSHTGDGFGVWTKTAGITFTSGTTVNVKLHSATGMDYIRLVQLS